MSSARNRVKLLLYKRLVIYEYLNKYFIKLLINSCDSFPKTFFNDEENIFHQIFFELQVSLTHFLNETKKKNTFNDQSQFAINYYQTTRDFSLFHRHRYGIL